MKSLLLLFFFWPPTLFLYAQNSTNDYIVTHEGDTIHGTIKEEVNFKTQVSFKANNDNKFQEYSSERIKAFSLNEEKFYKTISLIQDSAKEMQIFALVLVKGFSTLYLSNEKKNDIYYLKVKNELLKLTKNDSVGKFKETGELFHREDNRYKGILIHYLSDCQTVKDKISITTFSASSLSKLIIKYNNCVRPDLQDLSYKKANPIKFHFGPKFGYGLRTFDYGTTQPRYRSYKFDVSQGYTFGTFANFTYKNKFSLQPEVFVNKKGTTGKGIFYSNTTITSELRVTYLQFPVNFIYYFNLKSFQPYLLAGGVYGVPLKKMVDGSYINYRGEQIRETLPIHNLDEIGYRFGLGAKRKLFGDQKLLFEIIVENTIANRNTGDRIDYKGVTLQTGIEF